MRNGQLDGVYGPLLPNWIADRVQLASNIASALSSVGIQQAIPMFMGHVPPAFVAEYPEASAIRLPGFPPFNDSFSSVWWLPPTSSLFETVFQQVGYYQTKMLGSSGFLQGVPFGGADEVALPTTMMGLFLKMIGCHRLSFTANVKSLVSHGMDAGRVTCSGEAQPRCGLDHSDVSIHVLAAKFVMDTDCRGCSMICCVVRLTSCIRLC
jgi:hypothetical protein